VPVTMGFAEAISLFFLLHPLLHHQMTRHSSKTILNLPTQWVKTE
jgi:hypothetical protein